MDNKKCVYFINELERDKDGGYIPCIAVEGETGYYRTDWNWGSDIELAQEIADTKNDALGFTPLEALRIVLSSMKGI
jgi:hypothetical protein